MPFPSISRFPKTGPSPSLCTIYPVKSSPVAANCIISSFSSLCASWAVSEHPGSGLCHLEKELCKVCYTLTEHEKHIISDICYFLISIAWQTLSHIIVTIEPGIFALPEEGLRQRYC